MQTIKAATFLLFADHVAAFIANAPAWATSGLKEQARMSSLRQLTPTGARSSRRGDLSLSSRNGAPSWRYEVDDLIKAASPWGSIVEAEIIATDLFKVWDRLRFRMLQVAVRNASDFRDDRTIRTTRTCLLTGSWYAYEYPCPLLCCVFHYCELLTFAMHLRRWSAATRAHPLTISY